MYGFENVPSLDASLAGSRRWASPTSTWSSPRICTSITPAASQPATSTAGVRPRFPNARYSVRRGEWDDALHPHERNRASYFAENYMPLLEAGVLDLIDEDGEVAPGVRVRRTGGHTQHHQIVEIEDGGADGDLCRRPAADRGHLPLPYIMGYDLYPMDTLAFKRGFLPEAVEREYLILFEHDPEIAAGRIAEEKGKLRVERVL